ncbi:DUF4276 family protein [Streptomyces sp. NPDC056500]|uniref:DUF4276 family protein n=1 Tax=Streptomyces sp. NPDC056500 TaxID=3345840 RepID=UPI0036A17982
MRQIHILVEGQTEERLVLRVFQRELADRGVWLTPIVLKTSRAPGRPTHRGGVSKWPKIEQEIRILLRNPAVDKVTTLLDFYGLPSDTPGRTGLPAGDAYARVKQVEDAIAERIDDARFLPFLALHEAEAWVLAAAQQLSDMTGLPRLASLLQDQVTTAGGPELVNDSPDTAPSKRILKAYPDYSKVVDGPDAIELLGLTALRALCPHLDIWVTQLEE